MALLFAKIIKKEVFDLSDTMDLIAQKLQRQDEKLIRIENALENLRGGHD